MGMDIVVIGGGMAGARLAQQLAPHDVRVTLIGEEQHAPYNRVLLAEVLAGRYAPDVIALPAAGCTVRRVVRVDRAEQVAVCDDGSVVRYDRLVLATGSNPVLPPLRGLFEDGRGDLPLGVHAFRTMDDCLALSEAVGPGVRAVVVGGGLLGVSAARALAARGAQVVLAQQGEYLMERHLDEPAGRLLRAHLESLGVEVHTECRVRGLRTQSPGAQDGPRVVESVELADGYCLGADIVVLACGVRPRVGLAQAAGLDVAKGIVVDDELRTSDPRIHAIGDCAQHRGVVYGLANAAREQADVLARLLAGETAAGYGGTRALTRLTLGGSATPFGSTGIAPFDIAAFGDPRPAPGDDVLRLADATRGAYRKVVIRDDRLVGGILLGDLAAVGTLARTWEADEALPATSAPLLHLLTNDGGS
ncbi:FAD-dependent oxidoreductase [Streptomyces sp. H10-C2]|uniref:NAD(P)/FAD-dependent oxidoreductase n=1 Tax=unclassified Streptomyces TaxID=2593676 RepID=UPI0024BBC157|nr:MULTISPECIES: FAD-dependent oxidoreductase [unclassified Streptomyces]MDJ0344642.1 FAD-dependent oxidoreductase [Streptomyces sp. PH10-H1]MDJ0373198.1 FAD-dependent oxidoreductase [Streptomyces sp. H10-C2]